MSAQDVLKKKWFNLNWSFTRDKEKDKKDLAASYNVSEKYTPVVINRESICNLLLPEIDKLQLNTPVKNRCMDYIKYMENMP